METNRRDLLAAGAGLTALMAAGSKAAEPPHEPEKGPSGIMEIIHIYAGEDGVSHVGRVKVIGSPKPLPDCARRRGLAPGARQDLHHQRGRRHRRRSR